MCLIVRFKECLNGFSTIKALFFFLQNSVNIFVRKPLRDCVTVPFLIKLLFTFNIHWHFFKISFSFLCMCAHECLCAHMCAHMTSRNSLNRSPCPWNMSGQGYLEGGCSRTLVQDIQNILEFWKFKYFQVSHWCLCLLSWRSAGWDRRIMNSTPDWPT